MNVSVCMATYNGEKYVIEQIQSILTQLDDTDELIILDDCSRDSTIDIVKSLADSRISIHSNMHNRSHVYTFGQVIELAKNDYIFMADQDDIWLDGRIQLMKTKLIETGKLLVSSNSEFINGEGKEIEFYLDGVKAKDSNNYLKNIIDIFKGKTNYVGCAMAFRKELRNIILPIPSFVESHDLWIAFAGNMLKSNLHISENTLKRRIHNQNASIIKRNFILKIWSRFIFLISLIVLGTRIFLKSKI